QTRILALPRGGLRHGERVAPAEVVPVVDLPGEGNDLDVVVRLIGAELAQEIVGGGTAGATFRGEELDEDGDTIGGEDVVSEADHSGKAKKEHRCSQDHRDLRRLGCIEAPRGYSKYARATTIRHHAFDRN